MYSVKEIAEILGICTTAVRLRIEKRNIKTKKFDVTKRCFVYSEEEKNEIIKKLRQGRPKKSK